MRKNSSYSLTQNFQFSKKYSQLSQISSPISATNLISNHSHNQTPKSIMNLQPKVSQRKKFAFETDSIANCKSKIEPYLRHTTYAKKVSVIDKLSQSTEGQTQRNYDDKNKHIIDKESRSYRSPDNQYKKKYKTYGKQQYDEIATKVHQTTSYIQLIKKMKVQQIRQQEQLNGQELDHIQNLQYSKKSWSNININFKKKKEHNIYTPKPQTIVCNQKYKRGFTPNLNFNFRKQISPSHKRKPSNCKISDFIFGKMLGGGKFGTVFQATHINTNSIYALKKVSKKKIKQYKINNQFCLQIKLQTYLKHQNILQLYGIFDDQENIFLILEYMEQGTLYSVLKKKKKLTQFQVSSKLYQITKAIYHLHHNGITHRDIKPQNIVISNGVCKLCDFGWATFCNQRRKTYCGTFDYAAPQVLQGIQYDMSVDIWCLGILAYQLLVGKSPFYHLSKKQTITKIINVQTKKIEYPCTLSRDAISFIQCLLKKNPNQRPLIDQVFKHPFLRLKDNQI